MQKSSICYFIYYPPPKDFGGRRSCFGIVRPKPFRPSVRQAFLPGRISGIFLDFIVILQEYGLAYEDGSHQVWLHCTNWK